LKYLIVLLFTASAFCQNIFQPLYSEILVIPSDSAFNVSYIYKIPFSRLVFEKVDDKYKAGYSIAVEVVDSAGNFIAREIKDKNLLADTFEKTDDSRIFSEDIIEFRIKDGSYIFIPILTDLNSGRELKLNQVNVKTYLHQSEFLSPLIVKKDPVICNNEQFRSLVNYEGNIPFNDEEYTLVIPSTDKNSNNLNVILVNNNDTIHNQTIDNHFYSNLTLEECSGEIIFPDNDDSLLKNYFITGFNKKLTEGDLKIVVSSGGESKTFYKSVKWYNRPLSLNDKEFAIKILKYIEKEEFIKEMLGEDDDNYSKILFDYWQKYDPSPETSFNPLMEEYYQRVDYAAKTFTSISGRNGFDSDRGKIFIQFGKPQKIERSSNEYGKIIETWIYDKAERRFVFIDEKGTGDFSLKSG
jgi:GWxTD domain-containing protein